jgi:hypothetical protein
MKHYAPFFAELRFPAVKIIISENSCQFNRLRISYSSFGNNYCLSYISLICFAGTVQRFKGLGLRAPRYDPTGRVQRLVTPPAADKPLADS